ncbi:hypothetical protein [Paenibacillus odorifer]|nr:hypothetical protein [Paenibacillus odorifer]
MMKEALNKTKVSSTAINAANKKMDELLLNSKNHVRVSSNVVFLDDKLFF